MLRGFRIGHGTGLEAVIAQHQHAGHVLARATTRKAAAGVDQAVMIGWRLSQLSNSPVTPTPMDTDHTQEAVRAGLKPATLAAWNTRMKVPP